MISNPRSHRRARNAARLIIAIVATLFCSRIANAQTTGSVSGLVRDAKTLSPLAAATVTLRDLADTSAPALGDLTDNKGAFTIEKVALGKTYMLEVSFVGYEKHVV